MQSFPDQAGYIISLQTFPKRIVSLVPSQTELLYYLGLENEIAAITKFCVHPQDAVKTKKRIGGTKNVNIEKIKQLQPDLILANKEENVKEQVEELSANFPVWVSDVNDLQSALEMIKSVGEITGKNESANKLVRAINEGFSALQQKTEQAKPVPVCYLIWQDPYMTVGGDTFINSMLATCNFNNVFDTQKRYPAVTIKDISQSRCKVVLLSSEPFPFGLKHAQALQKLLPEVVIKLVDGEMFSWYGSRLLPASSYFEKLMREVSLLCSIENGKNEFIT